MTTQKKNSAVKAVSFMMLITLVGKVLGLVRDQLLAANYGNGMAAEAFTTASLMPRTFFDAVFASAISASFIPIFNEYLKKKGKKEAFALSNRFITLMGLVTLLMTVVCEIFSEQFVWLFAAGYDNETAALAAQLSHVMFPTIFFTGIAFSFVGILQSLDEFNVPAALSVASNAVIILYYIFWNDRFGVYGLAVAFLIGWAMQAIIQIPSMMKKGYFYRPDFRFRDEGIRKILILMLPVMVGTWIQPINLIINNQFASHLDMGVTTLQYANNLYTIIVGVFVLAIANLIFPKLSRMADDAEGDGFGQTVRVTLRSMMFFLIPMMVGLMVLSKPLVKLIYERGSFDALGTEMTGTALCFFAVGMIGYGVQTILSRVFYAKQEGKMPLVAGIISIGVNAALCWLLMKPMGLGGLALASAVSSTVAALILFVPTVKRYPGILDKKLAADLCKMAVSALVMLFCVYLPYRFLAAKMGDGLIPRVILVGVPTCIGIVVYMVLTYVLRVDESRFAFSLVGKFLHRGGCNPPTGGTPEKKPEENTQQQKGREGMTDKISLYIEDSFFFRLIHGLVIWFWGIWSQSLSYRAYRRLGQAVGRAFRESGIFTFLRHNWDYWIRSARGRLPHLLHGPAKRCAVAVQEENGFAATMVAESAILRLCNQNFLIICICALAFAIPILPTMLQAVLAAGTFALYVINVWMGRIRMQRTALVGVLVGLFALCVVYGALTSYHFPKAVMVMGIFLVFLSVFFVCRDCIDTEEKLNLVLFVLIATGVLIALYAIFQYVVGVEMDEAWVDAESFDITTRAYATFNNPNVLGEYLIVIGSLAAGMMWKCRNWAGRLFYTACFGILCLGLLATNSRGAMLGLMFAAGLFVLLAERRLIPIGIVALLAMPFILPTSLWERLLSSVTMSDSSSQYRLSIYQAGFDMIRHYWVTGIGVDAFNEIYPLFSLEAANAYHVHNLFLQEFIELGIVGFSVFLALVLLFFQKIYSTMARAARRYRFILAAVFGGFAGILLQGMTDHIWFDYSIVLLFWCVLGIGMAAVRLGEKSWRKKN